LASETEGRFGAQTNYFYELEMAGFGPVQAWFSERRRDKRPTRASLSIYRSQDPGKDLMDSLGLFMNKVLLPARQKKQGEETTRSVTSLNRTSNRSSNETSIKEWLRSGAHA
jgi:hypothetical protein